MKKQKFTIDQHVATGLALKRINRELMDIEHSIAAAYPSATSKKTGALFKDIEKKLREIRSLMEDRLFLDHADQATLDFYFGDKDRRDSEKRGGNV